MFSKSEKDYHILNGFWLKIIGMISMIFDHIGVFYEMNHAYIPSYNINIQLTFRIIGRISFIVFAFLTVEGILHSKKPLLYLLKLFLLSIFCDVVFLIATKSYIGNPITTLFLGGIIVYLLNHKNRIFKLSSLIPISLTLLIAFEIIPLKSDYDIYGVTTILLFYFSKVLSDCIASYITKVNNLDKEAFINSSFYLTLRNALSCIFFISFALIIYFTNPIWNGKGFFSESMSIQIYAIFGIVPIIFYNGKRGYNKPWFKYSCYAFFPVHIILIYLFFSILV